jgi:hypothetical protein
MVFTLGDVESELPSVLERALSMEARGGSAWDLYTVVRPSDRSSSIDNQFFSLTRSLEAYHREHRQIEKVPTDEHEKHVSAAVAALGEDFPSEFVDWATSQLEYPYEPSLRKRLDGLVREWSDLLAPILPSAKKRNSFIFRVVNTRNCHAHGGQEACANAASGQRLRYITRVLGLIATAQVLVELGIERAHFVELLKSRSWYQDLARSNQLEN